MTSLVESFLQRRNDDRPGCTFEGRTTSWTLVVAESITRSEILRNFLDPLQPQRFAILVDDPVEYMFWLGGALLSGACLTGLDPTLAPSTNASVLESSNVAFVVSDQVGIRYLDELGISPFRVLDLKSEHYLAVLDRVTDSPTTVTRTPDQGLLCSLIIETPMSGFTTFDVNERMVDTAAHHVVRTTEMTDHDICYDTLPLSCANSVLSCWGPAVKTGAEIVFQRTFTASTFLSDIREFNCTYFVFAGSMITELLDLPPSDSDFDHRLRVGFGTEVSPTQKHDFYTRFGCELIDANKWRPKSI